MVSQRLQPRRIAPFVMGGASSVHIMARVWRISRMPAKNLPFHHFLLHHSDMLVVLCGSPIIVWRLIRRNEQFLLEQYSQDSDASKAKIVAYTVHQLRQVFTALFVGLGLLQRQAMRGKTEAVLDVVERLQQVVRKGIQTVNTLDTEYLSDGFTYDVM